MRPWLERLLDPTTAIRRKVQATVIDPAARRVEGLWPAIAAIVVAIGLQASLPQRVGQFRWVFVALCVLLLVVLAFVDPRRLEERHVRIRLLILALVAALSVGNAIAAIELVVDLVNGQGIRDAGELLRTGGAIWLTNVIVFSLWYWLFDRGGPYARAQTDDPFPAFLFPQMDDGAAALAPHDWKPEYVDYLYLSFTNAMAFSPTD